MRETTGELNITFFVLAAIGVFIAFFFYTVWPIVKKNFEDNTSCSKAICESEVQNGGEHDGRVRCRTKDNTEIYCIYKG